jgi:hypothetical protein
MNFEKIISLIQQTNKKILYIILIWIFSYNYFRINKGEIFVLLIIIYHKYFKGNKIWNFENDLMKKLLLLNKLYLWMPFSNNNQIIDFINYITIKL